MSTKTLTTPATHTQSQMDSDRSSIRRLLAGAVINTDFCALLLNQPLEAISAGFGGENFQLSAYGLETIGGIQANSLSEFIHLLNEKIPIL